MKKIINCLLIGLIIFSLTGCAGRISKNDWWLNEQRPKIALVLGGGAARGFAHVGVIRVLEQEKIPIDMIVGTSVGSLIGAIYASHKDSFELEWLAFELEKNDIFDFSIFSSKTGPVKGDKLEAFVEKSVPVKNIEEFYIPFYAVAVDLNTGEPVIFSRGSVSKAVRASSSIPGVFTPLVYENRTLVDGGVIGNIAPEVARQYGADIVIVVDISKNINNDDTSNVIDITLQAISIMSKKIDEYKLRDADVVISPEVGDVGMTDFSKKKESMIAGMKAAKKALQQIRKLVK
ncbi:MAG: patatin-like phospholipase family protein [Elusimicrobiota bacterium]